jgi:hypothetical protein
MEDLDYRIEEEKVLTKNIRFFINQINDPANVGELFSIIYVNERGKEDLHTGCFSIKMPHYFTENSFFSIGILGKNNIDDENVHLFSVNFDDRFTVTYLTEYKARKDSKILEFHMDLIPEYGINLQHLNKPIRQFIPPNYKGIEYLNTKLRLFFGQKSIEDFILTNTNVHCFHLLRSYLEMTWLLGIKNSFSTKADIVQEQILAYKKELAQEIEKIEIARQKIIGEYKKNITPLDEKQSNIYRKINDL